MRLRVGVDLKAAALDLRDGVRCGRLDPVDLPGQQRRGARIGLRHRHHHDLVDPGYALRIPVQRVLHDLEALARHEAAHLEGAGACRIGGEGNPRLLGALDRVADRGRHRGKFLLPLRGGSHEQVGQVVRQEGVRLGRGQLHRQVVDLARRAQRRHPRCGHADLAGVELLRGLVQHLADVPHDRVGVEGRAVMELDVGAQLEDPSGLVLGVHLPFGRKPGDQQARAVALAQIPLRQAVIHRNAAEAVALEALVRLAERSGNVGRGHADAQYLFGHRRPWQDQQRQRERRADAAKPLSGAGCRCGGGGGSGGRHRCESAGEAVHWHGS